MNIVYVNGEYLPKEKATISVMDRGFLFGDGIYEVLPVFQGRFFRFEEHMQRMQKSLDSMDIPNPHASAQWKKIFETLIEKNHLPVGNYSCYLQITRGVEETRTHIYSDNLKPTVVAFVVPIKEKTKEQLEQGFTAITEDDARHHNCHIKAINLLPNILHMKKAQRRGALEVILIRDGLVTECTSSNIFIVKNNQLITPPLSENILSGTTRALILKLAHENHIDAVEEEITPDMLRTADEVWATGCTKEICPIVAIDEKPVGDGKVGAMWKKMVALYIKSRDAIHGVS